METNIVTANRYEAIEIRAYGLSHWKVIDTKTGKTMREDCIGETAARNSAKSLNGRRTSF